MNVNNRLKEVRTALKMSIREFSEKIYYSHGVYGQVEKGRIPPNDRIIELISVTFKVNRNWILTGKGQMFDSDNVPDHRLRKIIEIYNTVDDSLKKALLEQSKILLKLYKKDI